MQSGAFFNTFLGVLAKFWTITFFLGQEATAEKKAAEQNY